MDTNLPLPNNTDAELALIGAALVAADRTMQQASDLAVDDFYMPAHREAWAAILALQERGAAIDVLSVGDELKTRGMAARFDGGWLSWASATAAKVPIIEHVDNFARIVREKATLRRLVLLCTETIARACADQSLDEVMTDHRDGFAALEVMGMAGGPVKIGDCLHSAVDEIARKGTAMECFVPTHISTVESYIGGMAPGNMVVVAARPGMGKTAFADGTATANACYEIPCLFISQEMVLQELVERVLSLKSRIPANLLRSGRNPDGTKLEKESFNILYDVAERLKKAPLWIDDRPLSLGRIVGETLRWHAKEVRGKGKKIGLVAVDYLQLVEVETAGKENREQHVSRISRTLKRLAKKIQCPVMVLSQLNREVERRGGEPTLADLRESGAIEQDADIIMFPWRDLSDPAMKNQSGPAWIIIAKNRGGGCGKAGAHWEAPVMEYTAMDRTPDEDQPPQNWNERGER